MALLASLTTLHIAIKVHSEKNIKVSTLASLSRGQFGPEHIERMEWCIMQALNWKLHPPTLFAFVSHLLMLFPNDVHHSVRKELFEVAIYLAELSVCDSFFVKYPASSVAIAAIINVMEDIPYTRLSPRSRDEFWAILSFNLSGFNAAEIAAARDRLRGMLPSTTTTSSTSTSPVSYYEADVTYSPTSTTEMQLDESTSISTCPESFHNHSRPHARSIDIHDRFQYSPSPPNSSNCSMNCSHSKIASSPIVSHFR